MNTMIQPNTKTHMILEYFSKGNKLNRFQAEKMGEHTLNSSISYIQKSYGLNFKRQRIDIPNRFGGTTSVCEYWLDDQSLDMVIKLLSLKKKPTQD